MLDISNYRIRVIVPDPIQNHGTGAVDFDRERKLRSFFLNQGPLLKMKNVVNIV